MRVATPRVRVIVVLAALLIAQAVSAEAAGPAATVRSLGGGSPVALRSAFPRSPAVGLVNSQVLVALQAVTGQNQCVSYAYDLNGNITAKNNLSFGATATWGSSTFGCFSWTAP